MKQVVGSYELERELGRGATANVYLAKDSRSGDSVSVKVFHPSLFSNPVAKQRIQRELAVSSSLIHPNIVRVREVLAANESPALVMDYIEGKNLEQCQPTLPYVLPEVSVLIVIEILKGLQFAHEMGVIHRDLKPSNILVGVDGRVYVSDFGLAKMVGSSTLTETNALVGSLDYISPEQSNGETLTVTSDLFSVGSILYFLTTGTRPFARENIAGTISAVRNEEAEAPQNRNPKISPQLSRILRRALAKEASQRYSSALEFRLALEAYLSTLNLLVPETKLQNWITDPTGFTLDSMQRSAEALTAYCDQLLMTGQKDLLLENLAHLSVRAPASSSLARLTAAYESEEKRRRNRKRLLLGLSVGIILLAALFLAFVLVRARAVPNQDLPVTQVPTESQPVPAVDKAPVDAPVVATKSNPPPAAKKPVLTMGSVRFFVPTDAEVFWDFKKVLNLQEEMKNQKVGEHELIINRPGQELYRTKVSILPGKVTEVRHE